MINQPNINQNNNNKNSVYYRNTTTNNSIQMLVFPTSFSTNQKAELTLKKMLLNWIGWTVENIKRFKTFRICLQQNESVNSPSQTMWPLVSVSLSVDSALTWADIWPEVEESTNTCWELRCFGETKTFSFNVCKWPHVYFNNTWIDSRTIGYTAQ